MRVSYFNELDTFAATKGLDAEAIINGVCADPRIGNFYNNPSFGYGGYCLPKDTSQLLASYQNIPENLIKAIVESNRTRKEFIAEKVMEILNTFHQDTAPEDAKSLPENKSVGIFRLTMKSSSDNFRESAVQDIMKYLKEKEIPMVIYEPSLKDGSLFCGCKVINDLDKFKTFCRCILANRYDNVLDDVKDKVYTRDIFRRD